MGEAAAAERRIFTIADLIRNVHKVVDVDPRQFWRNRPVKYGDYFLRWRPPGPQMPMLPKFFGSAVL